LPLFGKEASEQIATTVRFEAPTTRQRWTETRIGGEIEHRSAGPGTVIVRPPDQELQSCLSTGGGAHGTGFESHIEGAVRDAPVADDASCSSKGDDLSVSRRVGSLLTTISGAGDDLTAPRDHSAHRHLSASRSRLGLRHGFGHEAAVVVIKDPVREHGSRITKGLRLWSPLKLSDLASITSLQSDRPPPAAPRRA
jgi:hypothetical protein